MTHANESYLDAHHHQSSLLNGLAGFLSGLLAGTVSGLIVDLPHGFGLNLLLSVLLGVFFGLILGPKIHSAGAGLVWGEAFGILWWLFGSLTLIPLFFGVGLRWSPAAMQETFPELLGQVVGFGAVLGLGYHWVAHWLAKLLPSVDSIAADDDLSQRHRPMGQEVLPPRVQSIIGGGIGGLLGSWVFSWGIETGNFYPLVAGLVRSDSLMVGQVLHYGIGITIGLSFGLLFNRDVRGSGPGIIWGLNYGFLWWVLGSLTIMPLLLGGGLRPDWSVDAARAVFPALISHMLYGALVGFLCGLVGRVWRALFVDTDPLNRSVEGSGTRGLRNLLMGQAGGIIGGLLFSIVMIGVVAFPEIAILVGSSSTVVGFIIHMMIGAVIGSSYGLLFQKRSTNYGVGLAWGLVYGLVWWIIGALTLFPILLRQTPDWSLAATIALYPSLVGHLLYGAGLGLFFQYLSYRYDESSGRTMLGGQTVRLTQRAPRRQVGMAAPALWAVTLLLGVLLPLLLSMN